MPPQHPAYPPPDHPQAVTSLVVGIVGLVLCGGLISPVAWYLGGKAVKEIDASRGQVGGRGAAQAGHVTGIIGTCYLALWVLAMVVFVGLFGLAVLGAAHSGSGADFHMG